MQQNAPYQPPTPHRSSDVGTPPHKNALPSGVYGIIGFMLLGCVGSFFNTSQDSLVFTILLAAGLLSACGLLFRSEGARRTLVGVAIVTIIASIWSAVTLGGYQSRMNQATDTFQAAMGQVNPEELTTKQKQQLASYQKQMTDLRKKAGRALGYTFTLLTIYTVGNGVVVVYLTRSQVTAAFRSIDRT